MNDKSYRPEVISDLESVDEYDTVYLGFPIWQYQSPTIISSFLENYDFTDKKIIPFAISGSIGMGETNKYLTDSCKGAILVEGKSFGRPSTEKLNNWINSLKEDL